MNRFIIDGFNLAFRSHFAFKNFSTSAGLSSGAAYGFLVLLRSLRNRFSDCKFIIAWDNKAVRKIALYPEYKGNRPPFQVDIPIRDLKDALRMVNIDQAEAPNDEADDVIASLVNPQKDGIDYIYSNDKDLLQLVRDGKTIVVSPKVGVTLEKSYDEEAVKARFGVPPSNLACYLAFKGDTIDNIPGVERLPKKVIAALCNKYQTPERIYDMLETEKLTDFQRQGLLRSKDQVLINKLLVDLDLNLDVQITAGTSKPELFQGFLDKYELKSINSETFVNMFICNTHLIRKGPAISTPSLFEDGTD